MPINLCIIISQVKRKSKGNRQISLLFEVFHSTVIAMKWQTRDEFNDIANTGRKILNLFGKLK